MGKGRIFTQEEIREICRIYEEEKESVSFIAQRFSSYPTRIRNILTKEGIEIRRHHKKVNKFLKEDFFETINSEEKAYWLGFLFTDGSVVPKKGTNSMTIRLDVQLRDKEVIENFKKAVNSEGKLTYSKHKKNGRESESVLTTITSKKMADDLAQYGVIPNKTYNTKHLPSNIPKEYWKDFLRGCIDGDGSIYINHNGEYTTPVIYFCSYHQSCCEDFLRMIKEICPITGHNNVLKEKGTYRITFKKKEDVQQLATVLYKDSNISLTRKYDLARSIFEGNDEEDIVYSDR